MSVMLEHQSVPQSPCTPDCPDRSGDCMLHCSRIRRVSGGAG